MNFTAIRVRFVLGTARVKVLGWLEEKKNQKRKMTKHDFHHFQVSRHFVVWPSLIMALRY